MALPLAPIHFLLYYIISLFIIGPFYYEKNYTIITTIAYISYFILFFLLYFLIGFFLNKIFIKLNKSLLVYFIAFLLMFLTVEIFFYLYISMHSKGEDLLLMTELFFSHIIFILTITFPISLSLSLSGIFAGHNTKNFLTKK